MYIKDDTLGAVYIKDDAKGAAVIITDDTKACETGLEATKAGLEATKAGLEDRGFDAAIFKSIAC